MSARPTPPVNLTIDRHIRISSVCRGAFLTRTLLMAALLGLAAPGVRADTVSLSVDADATVAQAAPNTNFGTGTTPCPAGKLFFGTDNSGCASPYWGYDIPYFRFGLAGIPAGATITSATLTWQRAGSSCPSGCNPSTFTAYLEKVNSSWSESGITFNNQPTATSITSFAAGNGAPGTKTFDVTSTVQSWYQNPTTNYGFRIAASPIPAAGYSEYAFSREGSGSFKPSLSVTYSVPTGDLTVTIRDQNGAAKPGAKLVRYVGGVADPPVVANGSGQVTYTGLSVGSQYYFEAYYEGTNPFDALGELWTTGSITIAVGSNSLTLQRDWPYTETLQVFQGGVLLNSSSRVRAGTSVTIQAMVRNKLATAQTVRVQIRLDRDRASLWDFDQVLGSATVPANGTYTFSTTFTPTTGQLGQFSMAVKTETYTGSSWAKTDSWDWNATFTTIAYTAHGQIVDFNGGTDADNDGYYETFTFNLGVSGEVSSGSDSVYGKMISVTTGQTWWSSTPWSIGQSVSYQYFSFDQTDFGSYFTGTRGNKDLDFTVEIWDSTKSVLLASTDSVANEPVQADDYLVISQGQLPHPLPVYLNNCHTLYPIPGYVCNGICWATANADILAYWDRHPYSNGVRYWNLVDGGTAQLTESAQPTAPGHTGANVAAVVTELGTRYYVNHDGEENILDAVTNSQNGLSFDNNYHGTVDTQAARQNYFSILKAEIDAGRPLSVGSVCPDDNYSQVCPGMIFGGPHQVPVHAYIEARNPVESTFYIHYNTGGSNDQWVNFFDPLWYLLDMDTLVPGGTPNDEFEDDDTKADAKVIDPLDTYGFRQTHNFKAGILGIGDDAVDWVRFAAQAGRRYTIKAEDLGAAVDTLLHLEWDGSAQTLEASRQLVWDCGGDTTAYVRITNTMGTVGNDTNYDLSVTSTVLPVIAIGGAALTEGNSGNTNAIVGVMLSSASSQQVTVEYVTADGTATAGADYVASTGVVTFAPSATYQTIAIPVVGETVFEADETFVVNLTNPVNGVIGVGQGQGVVTIINDDSIPRMSISDVSVTEGNSGSTNAPFSVTLSAASSQTVTVTYATANGTAVAGSDYTTTTGTLTFAPGATAQTLLVPIVGDTLDEVDETFAVNLATPVGATLQDGQGVGTIIDDDAAPTLAIGDATIGEGNSGSASVAFVVTLSAVSGKSITVSYATSNGTALSGSDYTTSSGSLTFAPGATAQSVLVAVLGDTADEPDETFFVSLSNPANATIADGQGLGTIMDDDPAPTISIVDVTVTEGDTGSAGASFGVTLSALSGKSVTVAYATANGSALAGSDYSTTSGTLTFSPGTGALAVVVPVLGDTIHEDSETFYVNLSGPTNATIQDGQGVGTILDNDSLPVLSVGDVTISESDSGVVPASFSVSMSATAGAAVTVHYATADGTAYAGSDYTGVTGLLTFAAGETTKTVVVDVHGDLLVEADETFVLNLTDSSGAIIGDGQGVGTILNDDGPRARVDFNGDGRADIFWRKATTGEDAVWLMNGATVDAGGLLSTVPTPWDAVGAGDLDGDGKADLVWRNSTSGENAVWFMNGTAVASGALLTTVPSLWAIVGAGDFDGNGKADLLWRNASSGETAIWLMNGAAVSGGAVLPTMATAWLPGAGDLNGDGKADILWFNGSTGETAFWLMNGTAISSGGYGPTVATTWAPAGVGDFDGDGKADLLWRNGASGENAMWLMNGASVSSGAVLATVGSPWGIGGVDDFDGDGKADIWWRNGSSGENAIWFMNGTTVASGGYATTLSDTGWIVRHP